MSSDRETSTVFILYGGTGDLAKRMVLPAFFQLYRQGLLPPRWKLVGNGRGDVAHEAFRAHVMDSLTQFGSHPTAEEYAPFAANVLFAGGGFNDRDPGSLLDVIKEARKDLSPQVELVHYLAVPPVAFEPLTRGFAAHGLVEGAKAVYEKPYGTSPEGFRELDALVHSEFAEEQVYRIDHFLGKEATQNIHFARLANRMLAGVWHRDHVAQVQIDVPETLDINDRAGFYDATGAARDMLVTHLFQVAAEVAMEPPTGLDARALQTARESVIAAFRPLDMAEVVLGQYRTYRSTPGIDPHSKTETYVAARMWVDTDRWKGVPFVMRTGKKLTAGIQRVAIVFKAPEGPVGSLPPGSNALIFDLAGSGSLRLRLVTKKPGPDLIPAVGSATLAFADVSPDRPLAPYVTLLHDVLRGDRSLFTSTQGLAAAWRTFAPLLGPDRPDVIPYDDCSWGPSEGDALAGPLGWQTLDPDRR